MNEIKILKRLSEAFGPSTMEDEVNQVIHDELHDFGEIYETKHKNMILVKREKQFARTIMFQAHTDEIGLRPYRYQQDGFIELTPMGGFPSNASNQTIIFYPTKVKGILVMQVHGSKTVFFADVGAKNADEAMAMVPHHSNGAYAQMDLEESPGHVMGKSFDDRAGCAAIVCALKTLYKPTHNQIVAVFTAREETGNWPVHELYRTMLENNLYPDLIVNVECCPGGPTPGDPNPIAKIGDGIVLVNMDASYEPDSGICKFMEDLARKKKIVSQHIAVRDGSGELGRLALGFGVPGYPLTIPCRYMHYPHSVIAKNDYSACIQMIREIACHFKG